MKTALVAAALIALLAVASAEKGSQCKNWVRSPKNCDHTAGLCCGDPYVCDSKTGKGNCNYASQVNKPSTLPGNAPAGASTLPGAAKPPTGASTLPGNKPTTGASTLPAGVKPPAQAAPLH